MAVNGEAIYRTQASPLKPRWGRCTQKSNKLYLHVFDWPKGELAVPGLKNRIIKACLLADATRAALPFTTTTTTGVTLKTPADAPDKIASVIVLELEGPERVSRF